jgi:O-antigen ligase
LAGLLAILQPLFFKKSLENILSLILIWLLIILTGSATGLVAGIAVVLFWLWFKSKKLSLVFLGVSCCSLITLFLFKSSFFYNSDRFRVWGLVFKAIKDKFITGLGLGSYGVSKIGDTGIHWQHTHNEYLQIVFEVGVIGLVLIIWCIWDYFKKFSSLKTDLTIKLTSIFFGFCLLCGVTFFSHLWQTSVIGMFAFASLYAIKNEVISADKN